MSTMKRELEKRENEVQIYQSKLRLFFKEQQCYFAQENWSVLKNRYVPVELIGTGGFAEVYKGMDIDPTRMSHVAIKVANPPSNLSESGLGNFLKHFER